MRHVVKTHDGDIIQVNVLGKRFPSREYMAITQDINGLSVGEFKKSNFHEFMTYQVFLTRYIHPQAPPSELIGALAIERFESLILR